MTRFLLSIFILLFALISSAFGAGVIQDGLYLTYNSNQLRLLESYEALKRNGPLFQYSGTGDVQKIFQYKNNLLDGYTLGYYPNSGLHFRARFQKGTLHGASQRYYVNGQLAVELTYRYGRPHGVARFYTESGMLEKVALYEQGRLVRVRPCDENGRVIVDSGR